MNMPKPVAVGNPSEVTNTPWIWAFFRGKKMQPETERIGKWLFFVANQYVDNTWQNVKKNVEDGKLWKMAKVSTAWGGKGSHVVCVYTCDHDDEADVMKIREHLRAMGFRRATSYKTDAQTLAGVYSSNTEGIAKYKA